MSSERQFLNFQENGAKMLLLSLIFNRKNKVNFKILRWYSGCISYCSVAANFDRPFPSLPVRYCIVLYESITFVLFPWHNILLTNKRTMYKLYMTLNKHELTRLSHLASTKKDLVRLKKVQNCDKSEFSLLLIEVMGESYPMSHWLTDGLMDG